MQNGTLTQRLSRFIEFVQRTRGEESRSLTVLDLRLECRAQRLAEYADWSTTELDLIEREAAHYGDDTCLSTLLAGGVRPSPVESAWWLHSPSVFAWT